MKLKQFLPSWPVAVIFFLSIIIFQANYVPGTYLIGWDVTMPEFNLWLNLQRTIFGVWQEYRGLGTVDGLAHTANIAHWLYIFLLSFLPQNIIRYVFIITTHFLGGLGAYYLGKQILASLSPTTLNNNKTKNINIASLSAALFYLLNFYTVQMFYAPLELFSIHYAVLPWGLFYLNKFLKSGKIINLLTFSLVSLAGVSQALTPTVFITYGLAIGLVLFFKLLSSDKNKVKKVFLAGVIFSITNLFWATPYLYSAFNKSGEISNSKINRYSYQNIYQTSLKWGDLKSLATFGGPSLDYISWNSNDQKNTPISVEWKNLYESDTYKIIVISFSIVSLLGLILMTFYSLQSKKIEMLSWPAMWIASITMLGVNVLILKDFFQFFSKHIPFFSQIFRFNFTKFSILYSLSVSIFIGFAIQTLYVFFKRAKINRLANFAVFIIFSSSLLLISSPVFSGELFFSNLRLRIPSHYQESFDFFNDNFKDSRIANFPVHSFWGWATQTNDWSYFGSGFTWQAIPQPMHHRAFDPWSKENETAFLQMNRALYGLDKTAFLDTFKKYHTDLILFDSSVFHPGNYPEALFTDETRKLFAETPEIKLEQEFGPLEIFSVNTEGKNLSLYAPSEVSLIDSDYNVNYTSRDQAYLDFGEYIQQNDKGINYPFSFLQKEELPALNEAVKNNLISLSIDNSSNQRISWPSYSEKQPQLPTSFFAKKIGEEVEISYQIQLPEIYQNNEPLIEFNNKSSVRFIHQQNEEFFISVNNYIFQFNLSDIVEEKHLGTVALPSTENANILVFNISPINRPTQTNVEQSIEYDNLIVQYYPMLAEKDIKLKTIVERLELQLSELDENSQLIIKLPIGEQRAFVASSLGDEGDGTAINCSLDKRGEIKIFSDIQLMSFSAKNEATLCHTKFLPQLSSSLEYLYWWQGENISGSGLRQFLVNPLTKRFDLEIISPQGKFDLWFPVYPSQNYSSNNRPYQFDVNAESYGTEENLTNVKKSEFISLPLSWLTSIKTLPEQAVLSFETEIKKTKKTGTTFYWSLVDVSSKQGLIVLPQSFDEGWIAFAKPSSLSEYTKINLLEHVKYNGWGNAWFIPKGESQEILIIFWPQLLSFLGYFLLTITLISIIIFWKKEKKLT